MKKNVFHIKKYNAKTLVESKAWKECECSSFDYQNFIICSQNDLIDGYGKYCFVEEKIKFYVLLKQLRDFIVTVAKSEDDKFMAVGSYFCGYNYNKWSNIKQFDSLALLSSLLKDHDYAILDIDKELNILDLILENNFRNLSCMGLLLKNSNMLIYPSHNMELVIFAEDIEKAMMKWNNIIRETEWEIFSD